MAGAIAQSRNRVGPYTYKLRELDAATQTNTEKVIVIYFVTETLLICLNRLTIRVYDL